MEIRISTSHWAGHGVRREDGINNTLSAWLVYATPVLSALFQKMDLAKTPYEGLHVEIRGGKKISDFEKLPNLLEPAPSLGGRPWENKHCAQAPAFCLSLVVSERKDRPTGSYSPLVLSLVSPQSHQAPGREIIAGAMDLGDPKYGGCS